MIKKIKPKAGQESVWDYPRPPKLEATSKYLKIEIAGMVLAETNQGFRVLETSHPPVYYFPQKDIEMDYLKEVAGKHSFCEFKGMATYWTFEHKDRKVPAIAWSYPSPTKYFEPITNFLAFYPSKADACYVNNELVKSQAGDFYGGWITSDIVGPFKGGSGTWGW